MNGIFAFFWARNHLQLLFTSIEISYSLLACIDPEFSIKIPILLFVHVYGNKVF